MLTSCVKQLPDFFTDIYRKHTLLWKGRSVVIITGLATLAVIYFIIDKMLKNHKQETEKLRNDLHSKTQENTLLKNELSEEKNKNIALALDLASQKERPDDDPSCSIIFSDSSQLDPLTQELGRNKERITNLERTLIQLIDTFTTKKNMSTDIKKEFKTFKDYITAVFNTFTDLLKHNTFQIDGLLQELNGKLKEQAITLENFHSKNHELEQNIALEKEKNNQLEELQSKHNTEKTLLTSRLEKLETTHEVLLKETQIATEACTEQETKILKLQQDLERRGPDSHLDLEEEPEAQDWISEKQGIEETIRTLISLCQEKHENILQALSEDKNLQELKNFIPDQLSPITAVIESLTAARPDSVRRSPSLTQTPLPSFFLEE